MTSPGIPVVEVARVASAREVAAQAPWTLCRLDGAPAENIETRVRFAATEESLVVLFESTAEPPLAVERTDGEDVFRDECVELFLAGPENFFEYDELVVNPRGCLYAARIANPDESRETWRVAAGEPPAGTLIEVAGDPAGAATGWKTWSCLLAIPWSSLPSGRPPEPGEERRGNAYRIARGRSTEFLALSPTLRSAPPDFHVPSRFARFVFGAAPR